MEMTAQAWLMLVFAALTVASQWGAMFVMIRSMQKEIAGVQEAVPDVIELKTQMHSLAEEVGRLRETVEETRKTMHEWQLQTAAPKTLRRRKAQ